MLDAKAITSRRAVYAQCIADAGECLMKARSNGKEKEVAKLQDRIWLLMWAREILCNYALPGETPDAQLCSTDKDVRCAMRLADPGCVKCGCQGFVSNPIPAPPPCDIKYDIYVRDTVDASEYTPTVGLKPQLIISNVNSVTNEWSGHVGEVVQEPNFSTVPIGSVVFSQIGATFWIQTPAGIGAYFPGLTAEQVDSTHITVTSAWPNVNDYQGYNIVIEAMVNGVWVPLYSGTDNLVTPQTYDIEAPATSVRYTYMTKDCKYGPYTAGTLSDPPIPVCGVPDLEYNWVSVGGGLQNLEVTMNTSADFTPGEMYVEQDDTPTSPQTFGALPDTLTFGPFSAGEVTVHLVNLITDCPPYVQNIGVPFVCSGPGYGFVTLLDGGFFALGPISGSGSPCYRDEDGIVHVDATPSGEGTYCVWVGDAETALGTVDHVGGMNVAAHDLSQLNPSGPPISFVTFDGDLSSPSPFVIDIPSALGVFVDFNTTIVAIDIAQCVNATDISLLGNNLLTTVIPPTVFADGVLLQCGPSMAATSVDAVFNACDPARIGTIFTSGDEPTGASAANRSACIASGWTLYSNGVLLT